MTHDHVQEQISQLIDGELDAREHKLLFSHLSECDECRNFLTSALILRSKLSAGSQLLPPADVDRRILQAANVPAGDYPATLRLAIAASIAFILLVSSIAFGPQILKTNTTESPGGYMSTAPGIQPFSLPQQN